MLLNERACMDELSGLKVYVHPDAFHGIGFLHAPQPPPRAVDAGGSASSPLAYVSLHACRSIA